MGREGWEPGDLAEGKPVLAAGVLLTSLPRTEVILQIYDPCDVDVDVGCINRRSTKICGVDK